MRRSRHPRHPRPLSKPSSRGRPRRFVLLASSAALLLAACAPETITKTGDQTANLYNVVLVMATVVFVGVEAAIIYNAIRYRRRKREEDASLPPQIHGNRAIEILWTAIPSVIVFVLFVISMLVLVDVNKEECPTAAKPTSRCADLIVDVTGFQWQWSFDYKDGAGNPLGVTLTGTQEQPTTLVLPVDRLIHFNLISNDVIHSFFVPAFFFKRDVVPGHPNSFEATIDTDRLGRFEGQCAELCGDFHNAMTFYLQTMTPSGFETWIGGEAKRQAKQGSCSPTGTELEVSARATAFDTTCLAAPANRPFTIAFDNQDVGVPHNVEIFTDESATERLGGATGPDDTITGPDTTTYQVQSIPPGKYFFQCDVHPTAMRGTFVVK